MPLYARPEQQSRALRRLPLTPWQIDTQLLSRHQACLPMESSFPNIHSPRPMPQRPVPRQLLKAKVLHMASLSMFDMTKLVVAVGVYSRAFNIPG